VSVAGLVLAAGAGRRFGGPKALAVLDGRSLLERAAGVLVDGGCSPVLAVVGAEVDRVRAVAAAAGVVTVTADDWAEGMGASLRAGLAQVAGDAAVDAVAVLLVDQPGIGAAVVERVLAARTVEPDRSVGAWVATFSGARGHPVVLDRAVWAEVATGAVGDAGARHWLAANPDRVRPVVCDGLGDPADVDSAEALAAFTG
jgi:CTP:molybdopterin cytidylyltransferase MocA